MSALKGFVDYVGEAALNERLYHCAQQRLRQVPHVQRDDRVLATESSMRNQ
jgi:hypothetical protein